MTKCHKLGLHFAQGSRQKRHPFRRKVLCLFLDNGGQVSVLFSSCRPLLLFGEPIIYLFAMSHERFSVIYELPQRKVFSAFTKEPFWVTFRRCRYQIQYIFWCSVIKCLKCGSNTTSNWQTLLFSLARMLEIWYFLNVLTSDH